MHPEFAPVAFIAAFSLLLALPWHWRAGNVATLAMIGWLFVSNIIYAIDALIWGNSIEITATIWCDITTKLIIGANFALPAACLCISIYLEKIASVRATTISIGDKRRRQIFEGVMCFGLPLLFMALHYIVQGHRFDIIEEYGCRPTTYFSILSIFLIWIPPILMAVGSLIFSGLALRHFFIRRIAFASHLNAGNSALTPSRYLRLMLMSILQMVWSLTTMCYTFWFTTLNVPLRPWTNWADVHSDFLRIEQYPSFGTPLIVLRAFYFLWWMVPASTFIFVIFFSFGSDALREYARCVSWIRRVIFHQNETNSELKGSFGSLPSFRKKESPQSPLSPALKSASTMLSTTDTLHQDAHYPPKYRSDFDDKESPFNSVYHIEPYPSESLSELPDTPSTVASTNSLDTPRLATQFSPPVGAPMTAITLSLPSHAPGYTPPHLRLPRHEITPSRPFTYPSFDATHRGI